MLYCTNGADEDLLHMSINSVIKNWPSHPQIIIVSSVPLSHPLPVNCILHVVHQPPISNYCVFETEVVTTAYALLIYAMEYLNGIGITDVVYMDNDTIMLKPVDELTNLKFEDTYLYACKQNMSPRDDCYNSGFLVMALDKFDNNLYNRLIEYNDRSRYQFIDQDFLNEYCGSSITCLPSIYNYYCYKSHLVPIDVKIIHFSWHKPWNPYQWFTDEIYEFVISYLPSWSDKIDKISIAKRNRDLDAAVRKISSF